MKDPADLACKIIETHKPPPPRQGANHRREAHKPIDWYIYVVKYISIAQECYKNLCFTVLFYVL